MFSFLGFLETNRLEILDYVPRDLMILYLEIVDSKHKQVGGCLQNLCQSVAIYQKYVLSVLKFLIIICKSL